MCDRYVYSGVAFSSAKVPEVTAVGGGGVNGGGLGIEWCKGPDVGLPAPDCVIFLDLSQEEAEKRGGYGGERYEERELQIRVRRRFAELQAADEVGGGVGGVPWYIVDASGTVEEVQRDINVIATKTLKRVEEGKPLFRMFEDGEYVLPPSTVAAASLEK